MSPHPAPLERVIAELTRLPGVGRKTAQRLAFHLLKVPEAEARALAHALIELRERIGFCGTCHNLADGPSCPVCADPRRERDVICVVAGPADLAAFERTGAHRGVYHVLGGALSPLKDVGPDDLRIRELVERVGRGGVREVILALPPDVEGEATAVYLGRILKPLGVTLTRLAQGLPAGADLEFTDDLTLQRAFEGRRDW